MTIAYLSNCFPDPHESYVCEEIRELRKHGCEVVPCSIRRPLLGIREFESFYLGTLVVFPPEFLQSLHAFFLCVWRLPLILDLVARALCGPEAWPRRIRCLAHTWLGAYLALSLRERNIQHVHVHHGYFASWAGMVAARLLGAGFSLTLHGSDLLVRADYLDTKLQNCRFCLTISEFNRRHILTRYPGIDARKVLLQRLGIDPAAWRRPAFKQENGRFSILTVGRLHPVKNHGFLVLACLALKAEGVPFHCVIAGEGEERGRLGQLIREFGLDGEVELKGHVPRELLPALYADADVIVLTSHSEGLPVTLMEAMAMERVVLAPAITGISEIVH